MQYLFLVLGSVLSVLFIVFMFKGQKYDYMLDSLTGDEFPLKSIYSVGLAWQDTKIGRLRGKTGDKLRASANLYYSKKYSEFYSRIIWAQSVSFAHLFLAVFWCMAGFSNDNTTVGFFAIVGIAAAAVSAYYFYNFTFSKVKTRQEECEDEFPNAITKLTLIVNSGVILPEAWKIVAYGKEGTFYDLMRASCERIDNGESEIDAIYEFGVMTNSDEIKKFTTALIQSIERGGGDLPNFLINQSNGIWAFKRQHMLQKGEKAAGKLLIPIALMFAGIMLIVISAAMQSFSM